ncbi:hypothetical protein KCP74_16070 [Salmonella enterica subsp. enterica]|nr:hypothetical protein KCP74_16070 [Salmonella enterica subsp. enterica]
MRYSAGCCLFEAYTGADLLGGILELIYWGGYGPCYGTFHCRSESYCWRYLAGGWVVKA